MILLNDIIMAIAMIIAFIPFFSSDRYDLSVTNYMGNINMDANEYISHSNLTQNVTGIGKLESSLLSRFEFGFTVYELHICIYQRRNNSGTSVAIVPGLSLINTSFTEKKGLKKTFTDLNFLMD